MMRALLLAACLSPAALAAAGADTAQQVTVTRNLAATEAAEDSARVFSDSVLDAEPRHWSHFIRAGGRLKWNGDAFEMGADLGYHVPVGRFRIPIYGLFLARPQKDKEWQRLRPNFYSMKAERRYFVALGGGGMYAMGRHVFFDATAGYGYSFGSYAGSSLKPEAEWIPWGEVGAGARMRLPIGVRLGCAYLKLPYAAGQRLSLTLGYYP